MTITVRPIKAATATMDDVIAESTLCISFPVNETIAVQVREDLRVAGVFHVGIRRGDLWHHNAITANVTEARRHAKGMRAGIAFAMEVEGAGVWRHPGKNIREDA